jgi:uncharacterized protein (DUF58 family)
MVARNIPLRHASPHNQVNSDVIFQPLVRLPKTMPLPALPYLPWRPPRLEAGPVQLNARRLYILPSRAGLVFALLLLGLLIGAINYGLSLAYLFTFWFAGLAVVGMLHTQRNLSGLRLNAQAAAPVFAGESASLRLTAVNPSALKRYRIALSHPQGACEPCDVPADGQADLVLQVRHEQRGWHALGRFGIFSYFPLGLFRCWSVLELSDASATPFGVLVYPRPAPDALALPVSTGGQDEFTARPSDGDDFSGLRAYQAGDTPRRIAWKAAARSQDLLTKQFSSQRGSSLHLDWSQAPERDTEARLSRLTRWVLDAHAAGLVFALTLPGRNIAQGSGEAHLRRCLEALARFGESDAAH